MSDTDHHTTTFSVSTPEHFKALGHPLRQRMMFVLGEPATISQLASQLDVGKGSVSHHLKVLRDVGLITEAGTRTVRGGTERYFRRSASRLDVPDRAPEPTEAMLTALSTEIERASADPLLALRHVRLTPEQAERLRDTLDRFVNEVESEPSGDRYGMFVTLYREASPDTERD